MELSSDFLEAQEIYTQILNFSDTEGGVRELGAACFRTSGRLPAEAMTRKKQGAGKGLCGFNVLWEPKLLIKCPPLKHLTTLPPSSPTCGYIVSFKKAFPSAIFAQVFPLYTLFSGQLQRTGERRSAKCKPTLISSAHNSADPNQPLPSHLLPSHPLGSHSLLLGNYVF